MGKILKILVKLINFLGEYNKLWSGHIALFNKFKNTEIRNGIAMNSFQWFCHLSKNENTYNTLLQLKEKLPPRIIVCLSGLGTLDYL